MNGKAITRVSLFEGKNIRKAWHNNEWWFSIIDIVAALTETINPRDYWYKMKIRVKTEDGCQLSTLCRQLKLVSVDGKKYKTDCANTESVLRIIQSIPSPRAEPFKLWLARVGPCSLAALCLFYVSFPFLYSIPFFKLIG